MPPASARTILYVSALAFGVLSLGDRGLHRLTGTEHGPPHAAPDDDAEVSAARAEDECPLDRAGSEPSLAAGTRRPRSIEPPPARAESARPAADRPVDALAAATPRAPPASA